MIFEISPILPILPLCFPFFRWMQMWSRCWDGSILVPPGVRHDGSGIFFRQKKESIPHQDFIGFSSKKMQNPTLGHSVMLGAKAPRHGRRQHRNGSSQQTEIRLETHGKPFKKAKFPVRWNTQSETHHQNYQVFR